MHHGPHTCQNSKENHARIKVVTGHLRRRINSIMVENHVQDKSDHRDTQLGDPKSRGYVEFYIIVRIAQSHSCPNYQEEMSRSLRKHPW